MDRRREDLSGKEMWGLKWEGVAGMKGGAATERDAHSRNYIDVREDASRRENAEKEEDAGTEGEAEQG